MKIKFNFGAFLFIFSLILSNNITYAAIYLFCAAAHELGHLAAARLLKIKIKEMAFDIAGAKIVPAGHIGSYSSEFMLCTAGPLASVILGATAIFSLKARDIPINTDYLMSIIEEDTYGIEGTLALIMTFSLLQAALNLLPVAGFDGGRMAKAVIVYLFGERAGAAATSLLTFIFALILWMASVYLLIKVGQGLSLFSFSLCMFLKIFDDAKT